MRVEGTHCEDVSVEDMRVFVPTCAFLKRFKNIFFNVFMFFHDSQKRALDLPELELRVIPNHLT